MEIEQYYMFPQTQHEGPQYPQSSNVESLNFSKNYNQLAAGVNRIRYLKKKQMHNHQIMTHHFTNLLSKVQKAKEEEAIDKPRPKMQLHHAQSQPLGLHPRFKYIFQEECPYMPSNQKWEVRTNKLSIRQVSSGNFLRGNIDDEKQNKESSKLFANKLTDVSLENNSNFGPKLSSKRQRFRLMVQKKRENYQEMRRMRSKIQEKQSSQKLQKISLARESKLRVEMSRQEGRKKIEGQYFRHLDSIRAEKDAEKEKKMRANEKKYKQILSLHRKEEEELERYEKSILMEEGLRQFMELASCERSGLGKEAIPTNDETIIL